MPKRRMEDASGKKHSVTALDRSGKAHEASRVAHEKSGSYPKSVIDDKRLCGNELSPKACEAALHGTGDGMASRNQSRGDACSSELQGFDADPSPAPEFPTRVWVSKPLLRRKANNDDDVLARPRRRHHIWWAPGKPQQGRNLKDLKGLKCHYTFGTRARNLNIRSSLQLE
jgi:hypothetical protein